MTLPLDPPNDINYEKYTGKNGCATKIWGPKAWDYLFTSIIGTYPVSIVTEEDKILAQYFKRQIHALGHTMPCIFCRRSFQTFYKELPIDNYTDSRIRMMYWLYLIKDKVNQKLLHQEEKCWNDEKKRLKLLYHQKLLTREGYYLAVNKFKKESFKTIPSPPFVEVLDKYEKSRAICSKKSLSCILPPK
jgi:hypothetical protein